MESMQLHVPQDMGQLEEMKALVCKSLHEMNTYLAKRQAPAADLIVGEFHLVECSP